MRLNCFQFRAAGACRQPRCARRSAFTLIEIMVVVAVMGVILAAGAPSLYRALHREGFRKTVLDFVDACQAARAQAIIKNEISELVIHPLDGTFQGGGVSGRLENARFEMLDVNLFDCRGVEQVRVKFFPNGTSDEMVVFFSSDRNEFRGVTLEITTGLPTIVYQQDLQRFGRGVL